MTVYLTHSNKLRGHFGALPGLPLTQFRVAVDAERNGTSEKAFACFPGWKRPG